MVIAKSACSPTLHTISFISCPLLHTSSNRQTRCPTKRISTTQLHLHCVQWHLLHKWLMILAVLQTTMPLWGKFLVWWRLRFLHHIEHTMRSMILITSSLVDTQRIQWNIHDRTHTRRYHLLNNLLATITCPRLREMLINNWYILERADLSRSSSATAKRRTWESGHREEWNIFQILVYRCANWYHHLTEIFKSWRQMQKRRRSGRSSEGFSEEIHNQVRHGSQGNHSNNYCAIMLDSLILVSGSQGSYCAECMHSGKNPRTLADHIVHKCRDSEDNLVKLGTHCESKKRRMILCKWDEGTSDEFTYASKHDLRNLASSIKITLSRRSPLPQFDSQRGQRYQ